KAMREAGGGRFLELGPKPTLVGLVGASWPSESPPPLLLASLRADRPEPEALLDAMGGWYTDGGSLTWSALYPKTARRVELPTYPWQRQRYWMASVPRPSRASEPTEHPLLGVRLAGPQPIYETVLDCAATAWLADHRAGERVVLAGAVIA